MPDFAKDDSVGAGGTGNPSSYGLGNGSYSGNTFTPSAGYSPATGMSLGQWQFQQAQAAANAIADAAASSNAVVSVTAPTPAPLPAQPIITPLDKGKLTFDNAAGFISGLAGLAIPGVGLLGLARATASAKTISDSYSSITREGSLTNGFTYSFPSADTNSSFVSGLSSGSVARSSTGATPFSPFSQPSIVASGTSAGNTYLSGATSAQVATADAPASIVKAASNTAQTTTGGNLQAVAATAKSSDFNFLATLASLASIFAVLKS